MNVSVYALYEAHETFMQISHSHKVKEPTALWSLQQSDFCFGFGTAFFPPQCFMGVLVALEGGLSLGGHKGTTDLHLSCSQFCYHPFQLTSHFMMLMAGVWF